MAAALDLVQNHPTITSERVGIWGHSQGGRLVQKLASQLGELAFAITSSAPTLDVGQQIAYDCEQTFSSEGYDEAEIQDALHLTQALVEAAMGAIWILGGINLITHCGGWMEHGLTVNMAKYVTDSDIAAGWIRYAQGPRVDDFADAMAAVREVAPQGHYLGAAHTVANYATAFHMPDVMDQTSFEQWEEAGSKNTETLGFERADSLLTKYERPTLDETVEAELSDFLARRMSEIPTEMVA